MPYEFPEYVNTDIERLDGFSTRALRELALHTAGVKTISTDEIDYILAKLKAIDDEMQSRRGV